MDKLIQSINSAVEDMKNKVLFEPKRHIYTLKETGEWLQGVSTVSSIVPKDWLSAWGSKEAVKFLGYSDYEDKSEAEKIWQKIKSFESIDEYLALLKEAKGASRRKSKDAQFDGRRGHALLEQYVKFKMGLNDEPSPDDPIGLRAYNQFKQWSDENVETWVLSEAMVCYPEKKYAGQLDGMAIMKNGKLALIDYKFSNNISEDYYLQTAGYAACFEPYGIHCDERIIIRLPKTLKREVCDKRTWKYSMVPNDMEVEIVATDYEEDKQVFFACLPVKKWINKVTK